MTSQHETDEPRYYGLYHGVIVNNADPKVLGRVTVKVNGVHEEESGWAIPFGFMGAGSAQRGAFDVPPVGSDVFVMYLGGDPERPYWTGGNPGAPGGKSEAPTALQDVKPEEQGQVKAYETDRYLVTYDDREGKQTLRLLDKIFGDVVEMDGNAGAITIQATSLLRLVSQGTVSIEGTQIQVGGRVVLQNGTNL